MNKKEFFNLVFFILFTLLLGFLILSLNGKIYHLTFRPIYIISIFSVLILSLFFILFSKIGLIIKIKKKIPKPLYFVILAPLVFYPIFRCFFRIPFIFCHVCPRKCIFGYLRPYTVPAVLLLNLDKRRWCYDLCPCGMLQDSAYKVKCKKIKLPKFFSYFKYIFLLVIIFLFFMILVDKPQPDLAGGGFFNYFFKGMFSFSLTILIAFIVIFLLSSFIYRLWCNYFCPIGTVSGLILKVGNKFKKIINKND
jgi:polyferredoxin